MARLSKQKQTLAAIAAAIVAFNAFASVSFADTGSSFNDVNGSAQKKEAGTGSAAKMSAKILTNKNIANKATYATGDYSQKVDGLEQEYIANNNNLEYNSELSFDFTSAADKLSSSISDTTVYIDRANSRGVKVSKLPNSKEFLQALAAGLGSSESLDDSSKALAYYTKDDKAISNSSLASFFAELISFYTKAPNNDYRNFGLKKITNLKSDYGQFDTINNLSATMYYGYSPEFDGYSIDGPVLFQPIVENGVVSERALKQLNQNRIYKNVFNNSGEGLIEDAEILLVKLLSGKEGGNVVEMPISGLATTSVPIKAFIASERDNYKAIADEAEQIVHAYFEDRTKTVVETQNKELQKAFDEWQNKLVIAYEKLDNDPYYQYPEPPKAPSASASEEEKAKYSKDMAIYHNSEGYQTILKRRTTYLEDINNEYYEKRDYLQSVNWTNDQKKKYNSSHSNYNRIRAYIKLFDGGQDAPDCYFEDPITDNPEENGEVEGSQNYEGPNFDNAKDANGHILDDFSGGAPDIELWLWYRWTVDGYSQNQIIPQNPDDIKCVKECMRLTNEELKDSGDEAQLSYYKSFICYRNWLINYDMYVNDSGNSYYGNYTFPKGAGLRGLEQWQLLFEATDSYARNLNGSQINGGLYVCGGMGCGNARNTNNWLHTCKWPIDEQRPTSYCYNLYGTDDIGEENAKSAIFFDGERYPYIANYSNSSNLPYDGLACSSMTPELFISFADSLGLLGDYKDFHYTSGKKLNLKLYTDISVTNYRNDTQYQNGKYHRYEWYVYYNPQKQGSKSDAKVVYHATTTTTHCPFTPTGEGRYWVECYQSAKSSYGEHLGFNTTYFIADDFTHTVLMAVMALGDETKINEKLIAEKILLESDEDGVVFNKSGKSVNWRAKDRTVIATFNTQRVSDDTTE